MIELAKLLIVLAPTLRRAVLDLIRALRDGDDVASQRAYEAARRAAFVARQK